MIQLGRSIKVSYDRREVHSPEVIAMKLGLKDEIRQRKMERLLKLHELVA